MKEIVNSTVSTVYIDPSCNGECGPQYDVPEITVPFYPVIDGATKDIAEISKGVHNGKERYPDPHSDSDSDSENDSSNYNPMDDPSSWQYDGDQSGVPDLIESLPKTWSTI